MYVFARPLVLKYRNYHSVKTVMKINWLGHVVDR